jgi:hypothetical protein
MITPLMKIGCHSFRGAHGLACGCRRLSGMSLTWGNRCVSAGEKPARQGARSRSEDEQDGSNLSILGLQFRFIRLSLTAIKATEAGAEFLS